MPGSWLFAYSIFYVRFVLGGSVEVLTKKNNLFGPRGAKMSLVLNEPFIQVQTLPPSMQHKCKEMIDFVRKTTIENYRGPTPDAKSF